MRITEGVLPIKLPLVSISSKWDERFLDVARIISTWSKDPSTKVGAIAVNVERKIVAQGYNGFPAGCDDSPAFYDNRESKYSRIIHAETNVICNACNAGVGLHCATIYIYGMYPCPECVKLLAQVQVGRIVFTVGETQNLEKWKSDFDTSKALMRELHIGYAHYTDREVLIGCAKQPETAISVP
jgi:dCMP deaminase